MGQSSRMDAILTRGHPLLEQRCAPVESHDPDLPSEIDRLHAALARFREEHGYGRAIAAPQIGILKRFLCLDLGATPFVVINPEITWHSDETFEVWDDCLSVPDVVVRVRRHRSISLDFLDELGRHRAWRRLPEDLAELLQHEIDHLDGILMTARAVGSDAVRPIAEHATLVGAGRPTHRLSLTRIRGAAEGIDPIFLDSPQFEDDALSAALGCSLTLKLETANPIRSFKGRGASCFLDRLVAAGDDRPLVCASAGNFGQAMAWACRHHERPLTIFAATTANPTKIDRMRALGADLRLDGEDFDAAKAAARAYADSIGGFMVEDGREPAISEGAGTIAIELLADHARFDAVLLPLGNGALATGVGRWLKAASPATRVLAVSSVGADAMERSWRRGSVVEAASVSTIADGIAVRVPIPEAVEDMRGIIDDVLLVDDGTIERAMRLLFETAGLVVEPAGAVGIAAILSDPERFADRQVATVLCGSHLTPEGARRWLFAP